MTSEQIKQLLNDAFKTGAIKENYGIIGAFMPGLLAPKSGRRATIMSLLSQRLLKGKSLVQRHQTCL